MTTVVTPGSVEEAAEYLRDAAANGTPVTIRGSGSDGRRAGTPAVLSTEALTGVVEYKIQTFFGYANHTTSPSWFARGRPSRRSTRCCRPGI